MMNQAILALREILMPGNSTITGEVVSEEQGQFDVATRKGRKRYPAAPGVTPRIGQRVTIQNGLIIQVAGAHAGVPTYYV